MDQPYVRKFLKSKVSKNKSKSCTKVEFSIELKRFSLKEFPYVIKNRNRIAVALNFFLNETNKKKEIKIYKKLINELVSAAKNLGISLSKKKSLYEHAFVKKKYFYYR